MALVHLFSTNLLEHLPFPTVSLILMGCFVLRTKLLAPRANVISRLPHDAVRTLQRILHPELLNFD